MPHERGRRGWRGGGGVGVILRDQLAKVRLLLSDNIDLVKTTFSKPIKVWAPGGLRIRHAQLQYRTSFFVPTGKKGQSREDHNLQDNRQKHNSHAPMEGYFSFFLQQR